MKNILSILLASLFCLSIFGCKENGRIVKESIETIVVVADEMGSPLGYGTLVEKAESKELEIITSCSILQIELSNGIRFVNHPKILFKSSKKYYSADLETSVSNDVCILTFTQEIDSIFAAKFNTFSPEIGEKVFASAHVLDTDSDVMDFNIFREYQIIVEKRRRHEGSELFAYGEPDDFFPLNGAGVFNRDGKLVGIIIDGGPMFFSELKFNYEEYSK